MIYIRALISIKTLPVYLKLVCTLTALRVILVDVMASLHIVVLVLMAIDLYLTRDKR